MIKILLPWLILCAAYICLMIIPGGGLAGASQRILEKYKIKQGTFWAKFYIFKKVSPQLSIIAKEIFIFLIGTIICTVAEIVLWVSFDLKNVSEIIALCNAGLVVIVGASVNAYLICAK